MFATRGFDGGGWVTMRDDHGFNWANVNSDVLDAW